MSSLERQIDKILDEMWERRENQLLELLEIKKVKTRKAWNKEIKTQKMYELLDLIELYLANKEPNLQKKYYNAWRHMSKRFIKLKGSPNTKMEQAMDWINNEVDMGAKDRFIYILWKGDKCLYVGQTRNGSARFRGHGKADAWMKANRLEIREPTNGKMLDFLECTTIHLYSPYYNQSLVRKQRGRSPCRICQKLSKISSELNRTFAFA